MLLRRDLTLARLACGASEVSGSSSCVSLYTTLSSKKLHPEPMSARKTRFKAMSAAPCLPLLLRDAVMAQELLLVPQSNLCVEQVLAPQQHLCRLRLQAQQRYATSTIILNLAQHPETATGAP